MASFEKRKAHGSTVWRAQIKIDGKRESATRDTKAEAQEWAEQRTRELKQQAHLGVSQTHTVRDAFQRYIKEVSVHKRGFKKEQLRLEAMSRDTLGDVKLCDLKAHNIAEWRDRRLKEVMGSSVKRDMNILNHCFNVCVREWGWMPENPAKTVKKPAEPPPRDRLITGDEIERICLAFGYNDELIPKTISHRIAVAFLFAIETAMRAGEICSLTDTNINGRVAHLPQTKNGFPRDVPLSTRAVSLWESLPGDGFELTTAQVDSNFRKAKRRADCDDVHFHDTRHLAVTRLSKKLDVLALARMTGHKDLRQLQAYYNEKAEELALRLD